MKNGEIISLEQLYKMLHISKRKAAWMLQNGIIPCEIRNTPTHKYSVRKEDVLVYMAKSEREKRKEIPVGIFNAKKTNSPKSLIYKFFRGVYVVIHTQACCPLS